MVSNYRWLVPLFLVVSSILAIVANSLLLLVFFKRRGLRTISNRFVINLLITNLLSGTVLIPLLVMNEYKSLDTATTTTNSTSEPNDIYVEESKYTAIYKTKVIETDDFIEINIGDRNNNVYDDDRNNIFLCHLAQIITSLVCISSMFGVLLIGVDQYFAVVHPLRYHSYINKSKSLILLVSVWVFSIFVASLDLLVFDSSTFWWFCKTEALTTRYNTLESVYAYLYFFVIILVPFLTICLIYFKIYFAAHKSSERMRKSGNSSCNQLIVKEGEDRLNVKKSRDLLPRIHSAPNITTTGFNPTESKKITRSESDRTNTNNIIISLKSKISNASVFKYREETRAARISVLVIFMVLICYFPYGSTIVINSYRRHDSNYAFNFVSIVLLVLSNIISPFLFAYRNRKIQRELIKLFLPKLSATKKDNRIKIEQNNVNEVVPFLTRQANNAAVPKVVVTSNSECEKKNILKRVCSRTWSYRKANLISVPDSCLEARASFSSASTQMSFTEE